MPSRISRRLLARHAGEQLLSGTRQATVVEELAAFLIDNRRVKEANLIVDDITRYLAEHGTVIAEVTSAFSLAESTKEAVRALIGRETGAKDVTLTESVDTSVLGGVKLALPGRELDTTIARKLHQLRADK